MKVEYKANVAYHIVGACIRAYLQWENDKKWNTISHFV